MSDALLLTRPRYCILLPFRTNKQRKDVQCPSPYTSTPLHGSATCSASESVSIIIGSGSVHVSQALGRSRDYPRIGNPREKGICFGLHRADFYLRPTRSILRVCDTVQALWSRWEACGNTQSSSTLLHWAHRADTRSNKKRIVKRVSRSLRTNPLYTYPRNLHSQLIASDESMFGLAI